MKSIIRIAVALVALSCMSLAVARDDRLKIGEWTSNKKTNAANKSDQEACEVAFVSAAISLQERARKEGGDAVVNIKSVYRNENVENDTQYLCGAGTFVSGVALRGTVVTLKKAAAKKK